jgi:hypothetical protein
MTSVTCEVCKYYDPHFDDTEYLLAGYCVANPPVVFKMLHEQFQSVYPVVESIQRPCQFFHEAAPE